jgi:hypothetical protein
MTYFSELFFKMTKKIIRVLNVVGILYLRIYEQLGMTLPRTLYAPLKHFKAVALCGDWPVADAATCMQWGLARNVCGFLKGGGIVLLQISWDYFSVELGQSLVSLWDRTATVHVIASANFTSWTSSLKLGRYRFF